MLQFLDAHQQLKCQLVCRDMYYRITTMNIYAVPITKVHNLDTLTWDQVDELLDLVGAKCPANVVFSLEEKMGGLYCMS